MDQSESEAVAVVIQAVGPQVEALVEVESDKKYGSLEQVPIFNSNPQQVFTPICPTTSPIQLKAPAKFYRKNREKMMAISSTSNQRISSQRPTRLRRLVINKPEEKSKNDTKKVATKDAKSVNEDEKKSQKMLPPPMTPNQIMIRKLYDRINRAYKASLRQSVKQVWKDNREMLDNFVKKHQLMQSAMATSSILLSHAVIEAEDIYEATLKSALNRQTTAESIKVIIMPERGKGEEPVASKVPERICQKIPVTTIGHVAQIPPVLDWTAIPHNLHEDDGKFLTNIPFLGDEFIDKDAKFIDEMVTLYEGKVHEAKDMTSFRKMDDEVLYTLVQAMMKIEAEEGPDVFKEEPEILKGNLEENEVERLKEETPPPPQLELEGVKKVEGMEVENDGAKKITFSDIAVKLFQPEVEGPMEIAPVLFEEASGEQEVTEMKEEVEKAEKEEEKVQEMEVDMSEKRSEERKLSETPGLSSDELDTSIFNANAKNASDNRNRPSDAIFSLLSSAFKGLGSQNEIRERYQNAEKVRRTPLLLPILPNGVEQQTPQSYSIPNIEGPFAKYLPKEATMHAYHVLFCRRCFTYDCKRHTGDDQVDVKYYKNQKIPLMSTSTTSNLSSQTTFNFLCKNPDCWQMNDVTARNPEVILSEWSPSDRSLFSCFIESFPSNYCFIAYMMRNKSCAQVKEYADLENVPKTESSCGGASSRTKSRHRKQRLGFNKKSSGHSHSKRNITRRWINNVKKTEKSRVEQQGGIKSPGLKLPPRYMPCLHEKGGECDANCTCRINKTSCEKFCTCPLSCPYRFPGCKCLSTCDSKRCICFAAARECDPDLCVGCGAHEHSLEKISCHNVNIQRKLHKHLLMGRSDISGWGIYIKNDAQKGEFIAEYRGELISHDESERRGHVYDKIQHTFLFELNDHFVVDATRKGNKARFVNSSKNPNCEVKRMFVNGDHRIGIYAKRFIEAGEELFYDYEDVLEKQQKASEGANRSRRD